MIFFRWKAKVFDEYRRWMGCELILDDLDFVKTLQVMHQQGLSLREARIVICTIEEHGPIEGMRYMGAILAGKQYVPFDDTQRLNTVDGEMKILQEPICVFYGETGCSYLHAAVITGDV